MLKKVVALEVIFPPSVGRLNDHVCDNRHSECHQLLATIDVKLVLMDNAFKETMKGLCEPGRGPEFNLIREGDFQLDECKID